MIVANLKFTTDLDRGVRMTMLRNALFVGDKDAHRFTVSCFRSTSRQPVDLTGAGVTGYFIRADQSTVVIDGKVEDNCAVLTLPAACYAKEGRFSLVIKASMSGVIHTILWAEGAISQSHTGAIIDPGEVVPTLDELLAQIAAMEIATNNANAAAGNANQAAADATSTANAAAASAQATVNAAATQAVQIATDKGNEAVQIATDKGNEAVQIATEQVEVQNQAIAKIAADLLTKAPAIECEASGALVTVTDAVAQPAVQLVTHIEPVQDGEGDPSPDNVRPIRGWDNARAYGAGKNLLNPSAKRQHVIGALFWHDRDGGFLLKAGQPYTFSVHDITTPPNGIYFQTLDGTALKTAYNATSVTYTPEADARVRLYCLWNQSPTEAIYKNMKVQLEIGNAATDYEPYQGQTLTADLPETVYGGLINWDTGVLTACKHLVYDGITDGKKMDATDVPSLTAEYPYAYTTLVRTVKDGVIAASRLKILKSGTASTKEECVMTSSVISVKLSRERIGWVEGDDKDAIISKINAVLNQWYLEGIPLEVVYISQNPTTIQLTPQQLSMLRGTNNLWSDCGDTSLVYVADTKLYIDGKFNELNSAILSMGSNV